MADNNDNPLIAGLIDKLPEDSDISESKVRKAFKQAKKNVENEYPEIEEGSDIYWAVVTQTVRENLGIMESTKIEKKVQIREDIQKAIKDRGE